MTEIFAKVFSTLFGSQSWLATVIVAMFPIIELKGAIPVGMSVEFWGENALTNTEAFLCSLLGSCLVVPLLALFFKPIINFMKNTRIFRNIADFIDTKVKRSSNKIEGKTNTHSTKKRTFFKMLGVLSFVAFPLPLTGVWTGTCIGVAIGLKFWQTVLCVVAGNIIAGLIITCVCSIFPQFTDIIFFIFVAMVIILIMYWIIKAIIQSRKKNQL